MRNNPLEKKSNNFGVQDKLELLTKGYSLIIQFICIIFN